jgi:hypothetical protein
MVIVMIDFSKAPEGATHYYFDTDNELFCYKTDEYSLYVFAPSAKDWDISWNKINWLNEKAAEIPKQLTVTCKTDREKMLCEQVLRMCRCEESQYRALSIWHDVPCTGHMDMERDYRSKPKKELVVPWEFLRKEIGEVVVTKEGYIRGYANGSGYHHLYGLSLDLEGIDLPVIVKRPE